MKPRTSITDWLPAAKVDKPAADLPTGDAFRPEWFDFAHGIRVGNLEPHERITQILRFHLERRYGTRFITDRWGRGVYWQWICWLPRANREAKPLSSSTNFGCAKLFVTLDNDRRILQSGLQLERGQAAPDEPNARWALQPDWDWHRLVEACTAGSVLDAELRRLLRREGFTAEVGDWNENAVFTAKTFRSIAQIRTALEECPKDRWTGFQLYYPMPEKEFRRCTGHDLMKAVFAAFCEVVPAMNACMQVALVPKDVPLHPPWERKSGRAVTR